MSMINFDELKAVSKNIEADIVGMLYSNPQLFLDYDNICPDDFADKGWRFLFSLGRKMIKKGYQSLTPSDVEIFVEQLNKPNILNSFNDYGGYNTIKDLHELYDENNNIEVYINDLKKWKAIREIIKELSIKDMDDVKKVSSKSFNELYDLYTAKLNNIFVNINEDVHTQHIATGLEELISKADEGVKKGLPIDSPLLSETINGINLGQITLIGGQSGSGKSTWLIQQILTAVFKYEEAAVFFLNEQDAQKFQQEMLTWIINNIVIKDKKRYFNKVRWRDGGFSEEEFKWLNEARKILEEKTKNNKIIIVEFKTYMHKTTVRSIKKYAAMGVKIFAIDTFKLSSDSNSNNPFWLEMMQQMREFDDLCKPSNLNVSLICTYQLGKGAIVNRYLSANDLGMSKSIIDVASVCLLIRKMHKDEYSGEKNEIKVMKAIENSLEEIKLDNKKRHSIIFIEKNRNGIAQDFQIVASHDFSTLRYEEVGKAYLSVGD